jgi:hypothetical protein
VRICKEGRCGGTWDLRKSEPPCFVCPAPSSLATSSSGTSPQLVGTLPSFLMHSVICSSPQVASFINWHKIFPRQKREGSFLYVGWAEGRNHGGGQELPIAPRWRYANEAVCNWRHLLELISAFEVISRWKLIQIPVRWPSGCLDSSCLTRW